MPYGAYVGTGAAGGTGLLAMGLETGSMFLLIFAALLGAAVLLGVIRRARRSGAHQRP
jgi:hypothetical protein